jgi:hypothetical protein
MKKIKRISIALFLFMIMGMAGCSEKEPQKEPQYEIYENHDVSACNVDDPLENVDWLFAYCTSIKEQKNISSVHVSLLKIIDQEEYVFAISVPSQFGEGYYDVNFCNCSGDNVFWWSTVNPPNPYYHEFHENKEFVAELFYMVKQ